MGSDLLATSRRAAVPFLAGAAAATAALNGLYATATVGLLVALWAAALVGQAIARQAEPPEPAAPPPLARDEERRLRLYLDLSPAPLVSLDADGRLRAINRAARRMFEVDELIGGEPSTLVTAIRDTAPGASATVKVDTGGGRHVFALVTADLAVGGMPARVAALVDIEADLRAAEAAALHDTIRVLGHEISNTLTPIASLSATAATMLAEPAPDVAAVRAALETVSRRSLALQRFGDAYRDLARLPPPVRQAFDLAALAGDLAQLFRTTWPGKSLAVTGPASLEISGDPSQLAQALWALLQNAAEAGDHVELRMTPADAGALVVIADDGPGIAEDIAATVFQPFFTTKPEGTGVGLALARQIVRAHAGELTVLESEPHAVFQARL